LKIVRTPSDLRTGAARTQRGVVERREEERHADFVEHAARRARSQIEPHAGRFEQIGASAARRERAIAVLDHLAARSGGDDRPRRSRG
jgi:hypothetical protein